MSKRDPRSLLEDILASAERIERFISNHNVTSFLADEMATDATVLNLAVIGEAANQLPDEVKTLMPSVIWKDVIGMRNIIIHKYFAVDLATIWRIATQDLPALKSQSQTALEQLNQKAQNQSSNVKKTSEENE